jgi:hypothetical protein
MSFDTASFNPWHLLPSVRVALCRDHYRLIRQSGACPLMHYQYGVHVIAQPTEIPMLFPSSTWFLIF